MQFWSPAELQNPSTDRYQILNDYRSLRITRFAKFHPDHIRNRVWCINIGQTVTLNFLKYIFRFSSWRTAHTPRGGYLDVVHQSTRFGAVLCFLMVSVTSPWGVTPKTPKSGLEIKIPTLSVFLIMYRHRIDPSQRSTAQNRVLACVIEK